MTSALSVSWLVASITLSNRGALAANGRTIAVLGCGIDTIYPPENRHLFEHILQNNAIISEQPPRVRPLLGNFPGHN